MESELGLELMQIKDAKTGEPLLLIAQINLKPETKPTNSGGD